MIAARRKAIGVLVGMSSAAAFAHLGMPTKRIADRRGTDLEGMFPREFGDWKVDVSLPVILPAPDVQAKLDKIYNQLLSRTYVDVSGMQRVMLSVAYGGDQADGLSLHLPEVCYPAQGFEVSSRSRAVLTLAGREIPVMRLVTRHQSRVEPVSYWITIGDRVVADRTAQKLVKMRYGLRGEIADGMLVRVSTIDNQAKRAFEVHQRFLEAMSAAVPEAYRARVLGASA